MANLGNNDGILNTLATGVYDGTIWGITHNEQMLQKWEHLTNARRNIA
ncbi:MAG TPA: hypothetical protein VFN30_11545 [Chitinophagaceae bacterium]|nr:hypothetical protein [Chitinophagaceae bacterium]